MHPYLILDVFTDIPLEGNQLAVFVDGDHVPARLMQRAARELNLSETVFVLDGNDGVDARIRIFTPLTELPFAGHPTLGAAFVVGERLGADAVRLATGAGVVPVALRREEGTIVSGEMDQPIPTWGPFGRVDELLAALGVPGSELPVEAYDNGPVFVYVGLGSQEALAALDPDMGALRRLGRIGVSCFAGRGPEFKVRVFGPGLGVDEDPATGSAAGPLAVHLARHSRVQFGQQISIRQGEEIGRPSLLMARADGSADRVQRVLVGGSAVIVAQGEYRLQ